MRAVEVDLRSGRVRRRRPSPCRGIEWLQPDRPDSSTPSPTRHFPSPIACARAPSDEFIGQKHILGLGKPLRVAIEAGRAQSVAPWHCRTEPTAPAAGIG